MNRCSHGYRTVRSIACCCRCASRCGSATTPQDAERLPIQGIKAAHVLEELDSLLRAALAPREQWWSSNHVEFRGIY